MFYGPTQRQFLQLITDGYHVPMEWISSVFSRTEEYHGICIVKKQSEQRYWNTLSHLSLNVMFVIYIPHWSLSVLTDINRFLITKTRLLASTSPSVCPLITTRNDKTGFHEIWHRVLLKFGDTFQFWFRPDDTNRYFVWRPSRVSASGSNWTGNPRLPWLPWLPEESPRGGTPASRATTWGLHREPSHSPANAKVIDLKKT
jgi:hypothetical protein